MLRRTAARYKHGRRWTHNALAKRASLNRYKWMAKRSGMSPHDQAARKHKCPYRHGGDPLAAYASPEQKEAERAKQLALPKPPQWASAIASAVQCPPLASADPRPLLGPGSQPAPLLEGGATAPDPLELRWLAAAPDGALCALTLDEYCEQMGAEQRAIYFLAAACSDDPLTAADCPLAEGCRAKGYAVILAGFGCSVCDELWANVAPDDFGELDVRDFDASGWAALRTLESHHGMPLECLDTPAAAAGDSELLHDAGAAVRVLEAALLPSRVRRVVPSERLVYSPCALAAPDFPGWDAEVDRAMRREAAAAQDRAALLQLAARRTLEVNPRHQATAAAVAAAQAGDAGLALDWALLLWETALESAGLAGARDESEHAERVQRVSAAARDAAAPLRSVPPALVAE
eukprot:TRINITY_DN50404_c0_g1_i1.p1 TRINITY_DN50404_c0_g1~~TRINITY_DN50404_c0_g1_i1.p1  ORF type:complete len:430 (+),score=108.83 TRINITY_DN50404_c0_g1_i1:78-1292(+)